MDANPWQSSPNIRIESTILILAMVGGSVDAIVILGFHVLTAAQTGNTILLAVAVAKGQFAAGFHAAVSIAGYTTGVAAAEWIINRVRVSTFRLTPVTCSLFAELVFLTGLFISWKLAGQNLSVTMTASLVALAAVSMGIQSAVVLHIHAGPKTTYVTGTLTTFMAGIVRQSLPTETRAPLATKAHNTAGTQPQTDSHAWHYGLTWLVYVGGALAGGWLFLHYGSGALALPVVSVLIIVMMGVLLS